MPVLSNIGSGRHITYHLPREVLDGDVAELLGLHAGDGYMSCGSWGIRCNVQDQSMAERIIQLARDTLGVEPSVAARDNAFEIRSGQKQVVNFFKRYDFSEGEKARTVQVPNRILISNDPEIIKGFLKGLFSSDGSFSFQKRDNYSRVDLMIRSKVLRDQFIELAGRLEFSFNKCDSKRVKKGFKMKSTVNFFNANLTSRSAVLQWMENVGTGCDTHLKKFGLWQSRLG